MNPRPLIQNFMQKCVYVETWLCTCACVYGRIFAFTEGAYHYIILIIYFEKVCVHTMQPSLHEISKKQWLGTNLTEEQNVCSFPGCFFPSIQKPSQVTHTPTSIPPLVAYLWLPSAPECCPEGHGCTPKPQENRPKDFPYCGATTVRGSPMRYLLLSLVLVKISVHLHFEVWKKYFSASCFIEVPIAKLLGPRCLILIHLLIHGLTLFFLHSRKMFIEC